MARALRGRTAQLRREHNQTAWLAWHVAVLQRSKKMVPLRRLMMRERERKPQSWQQMKAIATQLLLGGKTKSG